MELLSNCCGAEIDGLNAENIGICSECKEGCGVEGVSEEKEYDFLKIARQFHKIYEMLAPIYGYETREETKEFDYDSPNGKLMVAVCKEVVIEELSKAREEGYGEGRKYQQELDQLINGVYIEENTLERGREWVVISKEEFDRLSKLKQ